MKSIFPVLVCIGDHDEVKWIMQLKLKFNQEQSICVLQIVLILFLKKPALINRIAMDFWLANNVLY